MSETRSPALGGWVVFEGDNPVVDILTALPFQGNVNRPIEWPITLRVHRIKDGRDGEP